MRTIKFKAKRIDNGEWLEGYYRGSSYEDKAENQPAKSVEEVKYNI